MKQTKDTELVVHSGDSLYMYCRGEDIFANKDIVPIRTGDIQLAIMFHQNQWLALRTVVRNSEVDFFRYVRFTKKRFSRGEKKLDGIFGQGRMIKVGTPDMDDGITLYINMREVLFMDFKKDEVIMHVLERPMPLSIQSVNDDLRTRLRKAWKKECRSRNHDEVVMMDFKARLREALRKKVVSS